MAGQLSYHRLRQNTHGKTGIHQNTVCEPKPHRYYACAGCTGDVQLRKFSAFVLNPRQKEGIPESNQVSFLFCYSFYIREFIHKIIYLINQIYSLQPF